MRYINLYFKLHYIAPYLWLFFISSYMS